MQWSSSNLLKQQVVKEAVATRNILTDTTPLVKPHAFDDHEADALRRTRQLEQARHQEQMEQLKEEMINEARNQADQIREEAQSAGFEAGKTAGFQQGYNEGLASGKAAAEDLLNQAQAMIKAATAQVNLFRQDKQQELIRYGMGIAESLIDQRFADDEEAYVPFVESVLRQFEQPDIFVTVRCAPTHAEALRTMLDSKKESITHFRYLLLPDEQLAAHDFTIESDHALVVFELQNEIDRFLQKLLEIGDQHG